ncbi:YoaK family protein [Sphingobium phenoxybenzoativorans]|uniref:YoaK family protein n=1 Tax=Sphingobium phenoxybenzoativorans TaxID=1592790 RepID=UPI000871DFBC|nr:YoaK family protein [Sphingobium phenoxybenzoativorans]
MTRYDRRTQALAVCLSALAGYVDAVGYMALGGFFVSFMSGNTTRLGVGIAGHGRDVAMAGGLIGTFLLGVIIASLAGAAAGAARKQAVLGLMTLLITLAAACGASGHALVAAFITALAMGTENAVFERDGEVTIGLTYMTGTLVKTGQQIASALRGGDRRKWLPFAMLWAALAMGAITGAFAWNAFAINALWFAAAAAMLLTMAARLLELNRATGRSE